VKQESSSGLKDLFAGEPSIVGAKPVMTQMQISREKRFECRHLLKSDLDEIPTAIYQEDHDSNEAEDTCPICLEIFGMNDELRVLHCGHNFHRKCVDRWLLGTNSRRACHTNACPVCKLNPRQPIDEIPQKSFLRVGALLMGREKASSSSSSKPIGAGAAREGAAREGAGALSRQSAPMARRIAHPREATSPLQPPSVGIPFGGKQSMILGDTSSTIASTISHGSGISSGISSGIMAGSILSSSGRSRQPRVHSSKQIQLDKNGMAMLLVLAGVANQDALGVQAQGPVPDLQV
jgi:hypothetical protein